MVNSIGWPHAGVGTKFGLLIDELQLIWDEIGEEDKDRNEMLLELELECLEIYRRKVTEANHSRANIHQILADIHREIVTIASELGDHPPMAQLEKRGVSLKQQLGNLEPILEEIRGKKDQRIRLFRDIRVQICGLQSEIDPLLSIAEVPTQEQDWTLKKLNELQERLRNLQKEKNDRLHKVMDHVNTIRSLCKVLGCDFLATIREVHPSLDECSSNQAQSITDETIERLSFTVEILMEEKRRRMQQIQDLGASLLELWNLLDTPAAEQLPFQHVTCNIAAAEHEFVAAAALSLRIIEQARAEVERLEELKASKMKELVIKKHNELDEICKRAHIVPDGLLALDDILGFIEDGNVDPAELLMNIEEQIAGIREEAYSRKDIMDKIERWLAACEEEKWLEEYNKDENRYNATRGAHLNLKRAERARMTVNKIPVLLESLVAKAMAWEEERAKPFLYDGVRLLSTVDEYKIMRMEKEEEKRRHRDQRRLQEQLVNEQETAVGTKPSPSGNKTPKKGVCNSRLNGNGTIASVRRLSLGGAMLQQEQSTMARTSGTTPSKNMSLVTTKKEGRSTIAQPPPTTFASKGQTQAEDIPGPLPLEVLAVLPRMPLSLVAASGMRPNTNSEDHTIGTFEKAASFPISSPYGAAVVDEENTRPLQHSTFHDQQIGQPQQSPFQLQESVTPAQEFSFEEKRLAFMKQQEAQLGCRWPQQEGLELESEVRLQVAHTA
ncbi:hypothetical protein GOP47_0026153 [Adiantum capillus-veneris]|uniref:Uncharacterized protein n=1 Tax=Adiantum capillus-veneris TaxID=13818 RepID=A0A9D4U3Q1_ADICA|nr:hypothetical protein GOP47_0026153 [Adiantum capillus-veneris]